MQNRQNKIDWSEKLPIVLFALVFLFLGIKGILLIYPDLNIAYPFMFTDSYDWIANGLKYAGYDVNISFRTPGLPLIIAILEKIGALSLLPVLNQIILGGIFLVFFKILQRTFGIAVALLATVILFFNFFLQNISLYVLADIYAFFFILLGYHFYQLATEKKETNYIFSALFFSISFLFQYAVIFIIPVFIISFLISKKTVSISILKKILIPPLFIFSTWFIYRKINSGGFLNTGINYTKLIDFHTNSIFFYLFNAVSVLGVLVFFLFITGFIWSIFIKKKDEILEFLYMNSLGLFFWTAFWVFFYNWNDRRFLIYALPFLVPFISLAIQKIFVEGFQKTNMIGKFLIFSFFILTLANTSIPYDTALSFSEIRLTNNFGLKCNELIDPSTFNGNIDEASLHFARFEKKPSPLDLKNLYLMRKNYSQKEKQELNEIKNNLEKTNKNEDIICVSYEQFDMFRWNIDKNRYGNFFKRKVGRYPNDCANFKFIIDKNGLRKI